MVTSNGQKYTDKLFISEKALSMLLVKYNTSFLFIGAV
jgi:hypothetical protein